MSVIGTVLATLVAGGVGAVLRALAVGWAPRAGTTAANLAGTALLAAVVVANDAGRIGDAMALVLGVGLSGSLTTFSGWIAVVADGLGERAPRTIVVDVLLPLLAAVGLTVLVVATLG